MRFGSTSFFLIPLTFLITGENVGTETAYNVGRSSQTVESSSASSASESDRASKYSVNRLDAQVTENGEQTENERLRYKVKSLRAELHKTLDCLEHAQHAAE